MGTVRDSHTQIEAEGSADAEPDPQLLVSKTVGTRVTTDRRTWGDGPRGGDLRRALDEVLVDLDGRTPH
jgi:hypothetical protein